MTFDELKSYKQYVIDNLDRRTLLEQMAEEAAELSKACLKLIRASGMSNNVTPVTIEFALKDLEEEFADVCCCANMLDVPVSVNSWKYKRWAERLGYKEM